MVEADLCVPCAKANVQCRSKTQIISPTALSAHTHNWNPTGLSTAEVIRISASANYELTGIVAQADSPIIYVVNVASGDIKLKNQNSSSLAANRFALDADIVIKCDQGVILWYDVASARWRVVSVP